jgi:peptidyl-prolyl cis-trans isomerase SurA
MHRTTRAAVCAALLALTFGVTRPSAEIIEQVLVKVNGDIITKTDLEQRQVQALRARGIQPSDDAALKKAIEQITPDIIVDTIDEMLLVQRGRELGYKLSDEEFDRVVGNIRKENKLDTDEAFQNALKQEGLSMAELRKSLERQMLIARVTQVEVMGKVGITEEEARKYHSEHQKEFTKPATITIREILIKVPKDAQGINVAHDEEAKQRAEDVRKRLDAGEKFEQLASEVSESPSKANGGLIGPLNKNELTPEFQKLISGMTAGDVTPVLRTQNGYQLIKLESITAEQVAKPEDVRDKIADALYDQKRQVEMKKYLAKLRSVAIIDWKNQEIKKAWESKVGVIPPPPAQDAPAAPTAPDKPTR